MDRGRKRGDALPLSKAVMEQLIGGEERHARMSRGQLQAATGVGASTAASIERRPSTAPLAFSTSIQPHAIVRVLALSRPAASSPRMSS
jgi:hypothetical protein